MKSIRTGLGLSLFLSVLVLTAGCTFSIPDITNQVNSQNFNSNSVGVNSWFDGEILVGFETQRDLNNIAAQIGGRVMDQVIQIKMARIALPENKTVQGAVKELMLNRPEGLRYAEPNYISAFVKPDWDTERDFEASAQEITSQQSGMYDDDLMNRLWAIDAMNLAPAWSRATGQGVVVGIVDTGIDGTHPDLRGKQVTGMSCADGEFLPPDTDSSQGGNIHGTHVAGTALATGNNGGVVGVAPDARLMVLRFFDVDLAEPTNPAGSVGDARFAACVVWATTIGGDGIENSGDEAQVLNASWGGRGYGQAQKEAIDFVLSHGVTFVNSMGNSGTDEALSPKVYPGILGVGATTPYDTRTGFSTMHGSISVAAPGDDILSSFPVWVLKPNGEPYLYQYLDGTSMAAPQVTGAIALLLERFPDATPYQLKSILEETADDIHDKGFDRLSGWGRINVGRALAVGSLPPDGATVVVNVVTQNLGDSNNDGVIDDSDTQVGVPYADVILRNSDGVDRYYAQSDATGATAFHSIAPGTYEVLVGGGDVIIQTFRGANRISRQGQLTASSGQTTDFTIEFNTTLNVSISGSGNVSLLVAEPRAGEDSEWVSAAEGNAQFGTFSGSGGRESYSLNADHYPNAVYLLGLQGSGDVTVTVQQNGVTETYGPYNVRSGAILESSSWEGWWENFPDPDKGFEEPGPGGPWVY
jgi:subtilisin family serine protease